MEENKKIVEVTYRVPVVFVEGMILPDKTRVVSDWLPIRHGVLINEYMRWCRNHKGSKQEFAKNLVKEIEQGLHPILEKTELDSNPENFTYYSIMSQLDWLKQKENQVIVNIDDSTELAFNPNNLMILTTKQKAEEAERARKRRELEVEDPVSSDRVLSAEEVETAMLFSSMLNLDSDRIEKLKTMLNALSTDK